MLHIIAGLGEVGQALQEVLKCDGHDPHRGEYSEGYYNVLHVCFPFGASFESEVERLRDLFAVDYIVIHSTVPVGTSRKLNAMHSPIRGKHPNLKHSILTFTKYLSGPGASVISEEFKRFGIHCHITIDQENTEAGKLLDLMQFGATILLQKEIKNFCLMNPNVDFEFVYTEMNQTYNEGYRRMGMPQFTRPILKDTPGPIGGHCVVQMMSLLNSATAKKIIEENKKL